MKKVLHIATECYPAAKAGGMGDVVGALPLYLNNLNLEASVIIPKYSRKWFDQQTFNLSFESSILLGKEGYRFRVLSLDKSILGYPFYCIDIPGLFDREDIYLAADGHGYPDEAERNIAFQLAVLEWLIGGKLKFDVLHCHDHMTGLIPFCIKQCIPYKSLEKTPTVFTIHNGQYRGIFDWTKMDYLPEFDDDNKGLLEWDEKVNSLATAIKCSWAVNTVSPSYMKEIMYNSDTLIPLFQSESSKCIGILNGIDNTLWNPETDIYLEHHLSNGNWSDFKNKNKSALIKKYTLKSRRPLIGFIGRMAYQKGADILVESIEKSLSQKLQLSIIILGSGDKDIEKTLLKLQEKYPRDIAVIIAYDEKLARAIYASCDFLIMPSRFEPCGLNQLYAMRYGTVPIVSNVGGLIDTVPDVGFNGNGIVSKSINADGFADAISRSILLYKNKTKFNKLKNKITKIDFSWEQSARRYAELYDELSWSH